MGPILIQVSHENTINIINCYLLLEKGISYIRCVINTVIGFKKSRRGTSFMHITAEAMAKRKEREKQQRSVTDLSTLVRIASNPSRRQEFQGRAGQVIFPSNTSQPLLRRCQSSRPARRSSSNRINFGGKPGWKRNRDRVRKPSMHNVFAVGPNDDIKKPEADFLTVEGSVNIRNNSLPKISSPAVSSTPFDDDIYPEIIAENKDPVSQSHSVVVFIEETKRYQPTVTDKFHLPPFNKVDDLKNKESQGALLNVSTNDLNISAPMLQTIVCEPDFSIKSDFTLEDKTIETLGKLSSPQHEGISNIIEEEIKLIDNDQDSTISTGSCLSLKNLSVPTDKGNCSYNNDNVNECEPESSSRSHTFLGGGIESCI